MSLPLSFDAVTNALATGDGQMQDGWVNLAEEIWARREGGREPGAGREPAFPPSGKRLTSAHDASLPFQMEQPQAVISSLRSPSFFLPRFVFMSDRLGCSGALHVIGKGNFFHKLIGVIVLFP